MTDAAEVKERIILATTALIEQDDTEITHITSRDIARQAQVGLGLINYHFQSKDNLISICVQRIISTVITGFDTSKVYATDQARLTAWATHVFDFLFTHKAISRISILADLQNYSANCNSVYTQRGFLSALREERINTDKAFLSFVLTAAMQVAFLGSDAIKDLLNYDFSLPAGRAAYIQKLVSTILPETTQSSCITLEGETT